MNRDRELAPAVEIKSLVLLVDGLGDSLIEEHEGAPNRCNMNGQIGAVENQDFGVQYAIDGRGSWICHSGLSIFNLRSERSIGIRLKISGGRAIVNSSHFAAIGAVLEVEGEFFYKHRCLHLRF